MLKINSKTIAGLFVAFAFAFAFTASAWTATTATKITKTSGKTNVMWLQSTLNCVANSNLVEDGLFGSKTTAATKAFQSTKGLSADGIAGPITLAALNAAGAAGCGSTTTGGTTTTGALCPNGMTLASNCTTSPSSTTTVSGAEGILSNVVKLGSYNNTKIMESDKDKVVYGFEVTAKDADQTIDGLSLAFKNTNGSSSAKFGKYATEVSVWLDGKEIGRKAVSSYSDDSGDIYTYRFTGMTGVVKKDMKSTVLVAVSGASTIDSTDATNEVWNVVPGTSVSSPTANFVSALSANGRFRDYGSALTVATIDFQKAGSGDQKFKVTTAASNPLAQTVQVSNTSDTSDVLLAAFDVKAENAAMKLQKVPVTITVTGTDATVSDTAVAKTLKLYANGTLIGSESVLASAATTEVVTFGNTSKLQYAIASNATVKFEVKADINDIENTGVASTDFDNGDKIKVSVDASTMTVEIDNANQDTVTNKTGTSTGEDMTLRSTGVQVTMGSIVSTPTTDTNGRIATRTYTIPLAVKAFDDTVYLAQVAAQAATTTTAQSVAFQIENAAGTVAALTTSATLTSSDAAVQGSAYRVDSGATKNFTLTVVVSGTSVATQSQYRTQVETIRTFVDSALTAGTSTEQILTPANAYESGYQPINL